MQGWVLGTGVGFGYRGGFWVQGWFMTLLDLLDPWLCFGSISDAEQSVRGTCHIRKEGPRYLPY